MKKKTESEFVRYNKKEGTHSGFEKGMIPTTISPLLYSHAKAYDTFLLQRLG
jgi:hypothetical protein